jgi:hypothetical protein
MSLLIFFGMALMIFIAGVIAIAVTVFQWRKQSKQLKLQTNTHKTQETEP